MNVDIVADYEEQKRQTFDLKCIDLRFCRHIIKSTDIFTFYKSLLGLTKNGCGLRHSKSKQINVL